jgi:GR25 family glycosyltransferase involved in LPS biosynthesis
MVNIDKKQINQIIGISIFFILVLFFVIKKSLFLSYSNTVLGKLFAILLIIAYSYIHIGAGIFILIFVIIFYNTYKNNQYASNADKNNYLNGIDCIYWINLKRSTDRRDKMETMFLDPVFSGKKIHRIEAVDGKNDPVYDQLIMKTKRNTKLEYACLLSHLNAIKTFSESSCKTALIFEDDVTLEFKQYWKKSLDKIIKDAPANWEIIQLCYNTTRRLTDTYTLNNYQINNYGGIACMAAYIINVNAAKKFINGTYNPVTKKYKLFDYHTHEADHYLYKCLRTYTYKYPYFIYPTDNNSTLHPEDLSSHVRSKLQIKKMYESMK